MKKAVEAIYGKMAPKVTLDADYLSSKLEEVEQDEPRASSLDEVLSIEDCQALSLSSSLDTSGHVKITKTKVKGKLPNTTEGLRLKLRLEGNTWLMIASKCRHKHYLQGLEAKDWEEFTEYLLGDKVPNMEVTKADGSKLPLDPPFPVLLSYE